MSPEAEGERTVIVWGGAAVVGLLAVLWVASGLATLLSGNGWSPAGPAETLGAGLRMPEYLGDPRQAWPIAQQRQLPGAFGFYVALALAVAAALAGVVVGIAASRRLGWAPDGDRHHAPRSARWARRRDLRKLIVAGPEAGRLILGRFGRTLVAAQPRHSVIVFGPTGTFKTAGFAVPALREWEGPVLATSVKTDLILNTIAQRRDRGRVFIFDPARATGLPSTRISPLVGCEDWGRAGKAARWIVDAEQVGKAGLESSDFWFSSARRQLHPMLFAAARGGFGMGDVLRWVEEGEAADEEVRPLLIEAAEPAALRAWDVIWGREERQRSSIQTTTEVALQAYGDPVVAEETGSADLDPAVLVEGGSDTLYLYAPEGELDRLAPIFSVVLQLIRDAAQRIAARSTRLDPALLVNIDEAGSIGIPRLDTWAATGGGQGMQLAAQFQDVAQVFKLYGAGADSIINNFGARLFLPAVGDKATIEYIGAITGLAEYRQRSRTAGEGGRVSTTEASMYQAIAPANEIREAREETALVVYRDLPPFRIWLRDYRKAKAGSLLSTQTKQFLSSWPIRGRAQ